MERDGSGAAGDKKNTSRALLAVTGDGSSKTVIQNLLRKPSNGSSTSKPKTFKMERSPLLDQVASFLPQLRTSTEVLLSRPAHDRQQLDIENINNDSQIVEMNLLVEALNSSEEDSEEDGSLLGSPSGRSSSDSDSNSSDEPEFGPVTANNLRLPSQAQRNGRIHRNLIQEIPVTDSDDSVDDAEKSDGEATVASTSSGER